MSEQSNDYDNPGDDFDTSDWPESDAGYLNDNGGCFPVILTVVLPIGYSLYRLFF